jgi:glucose 1-dehydrogenase
MGDENASKTVLITGASRGIGRGIALVLAEEGYDMGISYATKKEEAEDVAHRIEKEYRRKCIVYKSDFRDLAAPARLVDSVIKELGHLDALVNNAAMFMTGSIMDTETKDIVALINVNFISPLLVTQAAARHMVPLGIKGSIVNITSTRAERAYPGDFFYGGAKAGLSRATRSIALDLAPYKIRVNCVAPGSTRVREGSDEHYEKFGRKIPLGRMGTPLDIARAVSWLLSEKASYITGITIRVDGGLILPGMPERAESEDFGWGIPPQTKSVSD